MDDQATEVTVETAEISTFFEMKPVEQARGRDVVAQEEGRLSARSDTHNW